MKRELFIGVYEVGGYEVGVRSLAGAPVRKLREVRGMEDLQICTGDERA